MLQQQVFINHSALEWSGLSDARGGGQF